MALRMRLFTTLALILSALAGQPASVRAQSPLKAPTVAPSHDAAKQPTATYAYVVVARFSNGSVASSPSDDTHNVADLDGDKNFNEIKWIDMAGASGYDVYRTKGGATTGKVATVTGTFLRDTGLVGDGSKAPDASSAAPVPPKPAVHPVGSGGTSYSYIVVPRPQGTTSASAIVSTVNAAQLNDSNRNEITWTRSEGAATYDVYRLVGGATQGKIGATAGLGLVDAGLTGDGSTPFGATEPAAPLSTVDARFIIGGEYSAQSSSPEDVNGLVDVMVLAPIARRKDRTLEGYLNARFSSVSTPASNVTVSQVITTGGAATNAVQGLTLDRLIQGFSMSMGIDVPIVKEQPFPDDKEYTIEPEFVGGIGLKTPVNAHVSSPTVYDLKSSITNGQELTALGYDKVSSTAQYVAFVPADRSRFYSAWFAGIRLKTHHYHTSADGSRRIDANFPGIIDLTLGQDQAVTAGKMLGAVGHLNAVYPLPSEGTLGALYVFGTLNAHISHPANQPALNLQVASPTPTAGVQYLQIVPSDRDEWQFGIGFDLGTLLRGTKLRGTAPGQGNP